VPRIRKVNDLVEGKNRFKLQHDVFVPHPRRSMRGTLFTGDCVQIMETMDESSVDAVVTDPPYGLEFMGREFDKLGKGTAQRAWHARWAKQALRVLKPGGYLLAFGGTRTYHHLATAVEEAGFEIRDMIQWNYGSGFPKSLNIGKAIDKAAGVEREVIGHESKIPERPITDNWKRAATTPTEMPLPGQGSNSGCVRIITAPATEAAKQWDGWGTALKPANEPILWATKPLIVVPPGDMIQAANLIGGLICLSLSSVKHVESLLMSSPNGCEGDVAFALWRAVEYRSSEFPESSGVTDMFKSPEVAETILNIVKLWRIVWDANFARQNTFTTSMATGLTTELKTFVSLMLPIIQECITPAGMKALGQPSYVNIARSNLSEQTSTSNAVTSAHELATLLMGRNGASDVGQSFTHAAHVASTVLQNATTSLGENLSPAHEPIVVARKPLSEKTVAANVLKHGTGGINIDGCRVEISSNDVIYAKNPHTQNTGSKNSSSITLGEGASYKVPKGRWPANVLFSHHPDCECVGTKKVKGSQLSQVIKRSNSGSESIGKQTDSYCEGFTDDDGNEEVEAWNCHPDCPVGVLDKQSGVLKSGKPTKGKEETTKDIYGKYAKRSLVGGGDSGGASRFFYQAKASRSERNVGTEDLFWRRTKETPSGYTQVTREEWEVLDEKKRAVGNIHSTVKPVDLIGYLIRLVVPPGGIVLDPFCGSGTVFPAAVKEQVKVLAIEKDEQYSVISEARASHAFAQDQEGQ